VILVVPAEGREDEADVNPRNGPVEGKMAKSEQELARARKLMGGLSRAHIPEMFCLM
jgi:hypothetical protein